MTLMYSNLAAIVLHFRTPECTLQCLHSLNCEGVKCVVVVDNSEDQGKSLARMKQGLDEIRALGLRIELVVPDQNLGFARGVDAAFDLAMINNSTDVLLINSDARLEFGALRLMMNVLKDAAFVVPRMRSDADAQTSSLAGYYQPLFALFLRKNHWGTIRFPSGCCLLIRRDQVRHDLFDSNFFFYCEDVALGHELQRQKIDFAECRDATVFHPGSVSAGNGSIFYEYHMNRGHLLLAKKLASNKMESVTFVVARCISLPLRATIRGLRFRSWIPWRGLIAATVDQLRGCNRDLTPPTD